MKYAWVVNFLEALFYQPQQNVVFSHFAELQPLPQFVEALRAEDHLPQKAKKVLYDFAKILQPFLKIGVYGYRTMTVACGEETSSEQLHHT
jgi:hypothetical protein